MADIDTVRLFRGVQRTRVLYKNTSEDVKVVKVALAAYMTFPNRMLLANMDLKPFFCPLLGREC